MIFTDHEAPVIVCPANQTLATDPSQAHAIVAWTDPHVTDNSRQIPNITCDVESGSQFGLRETEVTCQIIDLAGNIATCMFTVKIEGKRIIYKHAC